MQWPIATYVQENSNYRDPPSTDPPLKIKIINGVKSKNSCRDATIPIQVDRTPEVALADAGADIT